MDNKEIFKMFNKMEEKDLKCLVSIGIEFLINQYDNDFKKLLKDIKILHKQLKMI